MRIPFKSLARRKLQRWLAFRAGDKGIKFLLRLQDRLYFFTLGTIKIIEQSQGGIHPKHWITDFHQFFLDNIGSSDSVLEIGCAYGHIANSLAKKAKNVTAIDIRPDAITLAKEQFGRNNLSFVTSDFFAFPANEKFDVAVLSNVLEHVKDREEFLRKAASHARKLLIRVPASDRDWIVSYKRSLGLEWRLNKDHEIEYGAGELDEEIKRANLTVDSLFCRWGNYCCVAVRNGNARS